MSPSGRQSLKGLYEFGPIRLDPEKEMLFRADESPVSLTPKTFQILLVLVRHGQEVVTKDEFSASMPVDEIAKLIRLAKLSSPDKISRPARNSLPGVVLRAPEAERECVATYA